MTIIKGGVTITGFVQFTANYVPDPPTALTATWTSTVTNTVSLQFTPPAYTGSGPVTSYSAVSYPAGFTATVAANTNTIVIPGLPVYTPYVFNIYSTNFAGNSALSTASNIVYLTNGQLTVPTTSISPPSPVTSLVVIVTATNSTPTPSALITFTPGALGIINAAGFSTSTITLTNFPATINTSTNIFSSVSPDFDFKIRFPVPAVTPFGYLGIGYLNMSTMTYTQAAELAFYQTYANLIARKLINYAFVSYSGTFFRLRATKTGSSLVLAITNDSDVVQQSETVALSASVNYKLYFYYNKDTNNGTETGTILTDTVGLYSVSAPTSYYTIADVNGTVSVTTTTNSTVITGLNPLTSYTFNASATNLGGTSVLTTSNTITTLVASSSTAYTFPGSYTWIAPANVTSVAVVAVGAGGGGTYGNSINGSCYIAVAGGQSYFGATCVVRAYGGNPGSSNYSGGTGGTGRSGTGNTAVVAGGGAGGADASARGGGAGGYGGSGGGAGNTNGTGGAGGGGAINAAGVKGGGGGVGLFGQGCSGGAGGTGSICDPSGTGGSGGVAGRLVGNVGYGGVFGGGGAGAASGFYNSGAGGAGGGIAYINNYTVTPSQGYTVVVGAGGAGDSGAGYSGGPGGGGGVRIVWPGQVRSFPSTALTSCASIASTYVPSTPGITSVTANSGTSISLVYTAPTYIGGSVITSYTAVSSDGLYSTTTATATSGVIVIYRLQPLTSYSFAVYATNSYGNSLNSGYLSATTYVASSSTAYTFPGSYTWIAPANVTSVSAVVVGGGGGGRPGNGDGSNPGGQSYFYNSTVLAAYGGAKGGQGIGLGGTVAAGTGYSGGDGGAATAQTYNGGGGGAGGYNGVGGYGGGATNSGNGAQSGQTSSGGGGGGGANVATGAAISDAGGGGVGLFGDINVPYGGPGGTVNCTSGLGTGGGGGSGGLSGGDHGAAGCKIAGNGGLFGGGGGGWKRDLFGGGCAGGGGGGALAYKNCIAVTPGNGYTVVVGVGGAKSGCSGSGGNGGVRIVWPGQVRAFPSKMVGPGWDGATTTTTYIPQAPTAVSATANSGTAISVVYTAPTYSGGGTITSYTAVDSSGLISATTSTAASGVIVLSGLMPLTTYSFTVYATNKYGSSLPSGSVSATTYVANSSTSYIFPGSYTWVAPTNVTAVSAVVVGGGGGGSAGGRSGGAGGQSSFISASTVAANPGAGAQAGTYGGGGGGGGTTQAGAGGSGGAGSARSVGGGAGGYANNGGTGIGVGGCGGSGGAGGYNSTTLVANGGGGVGLFGQGANGAGGVTSSTGVGVAGGGGSGGLSSVGRCGGLFGGGGGSEDNSGGGGGGGALAYANNLSVTPGSNYTVIVGGGGNTAGSPGAVRLVWPGQVRSFPSTMVAARYETGLSTSSVYIPSTPAITSVTVNSGTMISVAYNAPTYKGGAAVSSYTAVVNPGNITASTATSESGVIPVYGLTPLTTYSVSVYATNQYGSSAASSISSLTTLVGNGEAAYITAGTYSWIAPANVTSVSIVAVGAGGGGCGVGTASNFIDSTYLQANGGGNGSGVGGGTSGRSGYVGYQGGCSGVRSLNGPGGGGGAAGYAGRGGTGGAGGNSVGSAGTGGGGGGGATAAGKQGAGGGGVGIYGQGSNGAAGSVISGLQGYGGGGGSGGQPGGNSDALCQPAGGPGQYAGGKFGGGAGSGGNRGGGNGGGLAYLNNFTVTPGNSYAITVGAGGTSDYGASNQAGGVGAVRIVWPGSVRQFPSTAVGPS